MDRQTDPREGPSGAPLRRTTGSFPDPPPQRPARPPDPDPQPGPRAGGRALAAGCVTERCGARLPLPTRAQRGVDCRCRELPPCDGC